MGFRPAQFALGACRKNKVENDCIGKALNTKYGYKYNSGDDEDVAQEILADTEVFKFQREHTHIGYHQQRHEDNCQRHYEIAPIDMFGHPLLGVALHPGGGADPEDSVGRNRESLEYGRLRIVEIELCQTQPTHDWDNQAYVGNPPRGAPHNQNIIQQHGGSHTEADEVGERVELFAERRRSRCPRPSRSVEKIEEGGRSDQYPYNLTSVEAP